MCYSLWTSWNARWIFVWQSSAYVELHQPWRFVTILTLVSVSLARCVRGSGSMYFGLYMGPSEYSHSSTKGPFFLHPQFDPVAYKRLSAIVFFCSHLLHYYSRGTNAGRCKRFFTSPTCPDRSGAHPASYLLLSTQQYCAILQELWVPEWSLREI
jgi:hypothetical protein